MIHIIKKLLTATAMVITACPATTGWGQTTEIPTEVAKDFQWDKTIITPKFVFLAIPFIPQSKFGICTAASALNVMSYIDPSIQLSQEEFFKVISGGARTAGATLDEIIRGIRNMGFQVTTVEAKSMLLNDYVALIETTLASNRPIIALKPGHAVTLIGYNKETKRIFLWNQAEALWHPNAQSQPKPKGELPAGMSHVPENGIGGTTPLILLIDKGKAGKNGNEPLPPLPEKEQMEKIVGAPLEDLQKHNLSASSGGQDNNRTYAQAAVPQLVKNLLRDHRTILIPKGKGLLQIRPDENKNNTQTNMLTVNLLPEKTVRQSTLTGIANDIAFSNGVFYSYSP